MREQKSPSRLPTEHEKDGRPDSLESGPLTIEGRRIARVTVRDYASAQDRTIPVPSNGALIVEFREPEPVSLPNPPRRDNVQDDWVI